MAVVRLFVSLTVLIAVTSSLGCDGKAKKIPITKKAATARTETDKVLDQMVHESKNCLPLKRVADHFRGQEENVFSLSTYDVDIGQLTTIGSDKGVQFTSNDDAVLKAQAAFYFLQPRYVFASGKQMGASDDFGVLLNLTSQDECKEFRIQGRYDGIDKAYDQVFKIIGHSSNHITARNLVTDEVRTYLLTNSSELEVTRFWVERRPICGKSIPSGQVVKETAVLAWGDSLRRVRLRRAYAQILADHIQEPKEIKDKLIRAADKPHPVSKTKERLQRPSTQDNLSADSISVSYPTYFFVRDEISQRKIENLTCN